MTQLDQAAAGTVTNDHFQQEHSSFVDSIADGCSKDEIEEGVTTYTYMLV